MLFELSLDSFSFVESNETWVEILGKLDTLVLGDKGKDASPCLVLGEEESKEALGSLLLHLLLAGVRCLTHEVLLQKADLEVEDGA